VGFSHRVFLGGPASISDAVMNNSMCAPPPPPPTPSVPSRPADRDCGDFSTWAQAQNFFTTYYPYYGDFSRLDADNDHIACESLPGAP
jgi:hypothetical protein